MTIEKMDIQKHKSPHDVDRDGACRRCAKVVEDYSELCEYSHFSFLCTGDKNIPLPPEQEAMIDKINELVEQINSLLWHFEGNMKVEE